jgi:large subunit ribosomal protein L10
MKSKLQKGEEMKKAKGLLEKSGSLIFTDFTKVSAEDVRTLRKELKKSGAHFLVIKKRLLGLLLKERGIDANLGQFKVSVGTIFSEGGADVAAGPAYRFFAGLEVPEGGAKDMWTNKILGGYDLAGNAPIDGAQMIAIGKLPPREVLLAQLLGAMAGPVRAFLYVLSEKAKQGGAAPVAAAASSESAPAEASPAPSEEAPASDAVPSEEASAGSAE